MIRRSWTSMCRAARWYQAGFTTAAASLTSPELTVGLHEIVDEHLYAQQGIEELTAWLSRYPIRD